MAFQESTQAVLNFKHVSATRQEQSVSGIPWIHISQNSPYFITEDGKSWTPIGQNDSVTWPELKGVFMRRDISRAEEYLQMLSQHGVTCLRLMLEYCQGQHRYFEKPAGIFQPRIIRMWDDIFHLCEKYRLRILLTPYDTFWMWLRWKQHPYNKINGGFCKKRNQWLLCTNNWQAIKSRLEFATERWGSSGALFAWDLWNEIHPAHANNSVEYFSDFVQNISSFLRATELRLHGRAHLQTVSVFGPVLQKEPNAAECIFRHPMLDFASVHFYESNTIDNPKNTVDAAISTGKLTREALRHIQNNRPFLDSEHGPIHIFKDKHKTLSEPFDDEYFCHMQWAHFASGGAGGGMRWPNRNPHSLTAGMRKSQQALARFLPLINWKDFHRVNLNNEICISDAGLVGFCCADANQAILWLLRKNSINKCGMLNKELKAKKSYITIPGLIKGKYRITGWNTKSGVTLNVFHADNTNEKQLCLEIPPVVTNLAFAITLIHSHNIYTFKPKLFM